MITHSGTSHSQSLPLPLLPVIRILLADDDIDDCELFHEALTELNFLFDLSLVHNGEQLMTALKECTELPDILFLDLNMPKKNGFQCLSEIKASDLLKHLPVVIISTSFEHRIITLLYNVGAMFYLRKPNEFSKLKILIDNAIALTTQKKYSQPPIEQYVLTC